MKVVCDYCDCYIEATDEKCPNCGAPNTHFVRTASDTPKTIEQLKDFCIRKNLPLEKMHVHIGENYNQPKAFGIYKDPATGHFIVYKNKGDGTRSIRYEGTDEAYAVNEIYMKIKDLILDARNNSTPKTETKFFPEQHVGKKGKLITRIITIVLILAALWFVGTKFIGKGFNLGGNYGVGSVVESISNIFGGWDSDDYSDSGNSVTNDWDTNDDWDSDTDFDVGDLFDSFDFDWDSDW